MLQRAWRPGVKAGWVTGDTVYGHDSQFRRYPEQNGQPYVLAVPANQPLFGGEYRSTVGAVAESLPAAAWTGAGAGDGAKGPREYDWAVRAFGAVDDRGWQLRLVVRRHRGRPDERAYYFARGPAATPPAVLIRAAGSRWRVGECLELAKGDCGLGEYEVRSWAGWHRHVTLSLLALAVLSVIRSRTGKPGGRKRGDGADPADGTRGAEAPRQAGLGPAHPGRASVGVARVAS